MSVKLLEFPRDTVLSDVPGMLRKMADQIERGELDAKIAMLVLVDSTWKTKLYGFGHVASAVEGLGWLVRALHDG